MTFWRVSVEVSNFNFDDFICTSKNKKEIKYKLKRERKNEVETEWPSGLRQ